MRMFLIELDSLSTVDLLAQTDKRKRKMNIEKLLNF